jgi:N-acyl-D-amino-acid deacylase
MRMRLSGITSLVVILAACARSHPAAPTPAPGYDVVIENGRIVDGTGAAWFYGDLAISGDRIARIAPRGMLRSAPARRRVDASGLVVAPGFIDIQGQSGGDFLFGDGRDVSKVTQGITTEILGEGSTPAPANGKTLEGADLSDANVAATVKTFEGEHGFDAWLHAMETHGISPNVGSFIGAGTVRQYAKGMTMGPATPPELDSMRTIVSNAMRDGAFGVASALIYPPGNYASTMELIEEARAMSPLGGVYITHMRSEADQFLEALDEAIRIGREGNVPVEVYHLKAAGRRNWTKAAQAIAKIDSARAAGQDVQADMYPYVAGGTGLTACLPPWSAADGKLFDNLASQEMRTKMRAEIEHQTTEWENLCQLATPEGVLVLGLRKPENKQWAGKRLSEIATGMSKDWIDAAMDLILSERQRVGTVYFLMDENNVKLQLRQPWIKIGTDAGGADPDSARGLVHPRSYGTYPRILGKYVRDEHVLPLEDAIRKMSSAVATRLSIHDRGVLREGMYADVVVFDPNTVIDRATFDQPHQPSIGVRYVFVNGTAVVQEGKHTGAKPGRVVRGPGYRREPAGAGGTPLPTAAGRATSR